MWTEHLRHWSGSTWTEGDQAILPPAGTEIPQIESEPLGPLAVVQATGSDTSNVGIGPYVGDSPTSAPDTDHEAALAVERFSHSARLLRHPLLRGIVRRRRMLERSVVLIGGVLIVALGIVFAVHNSNNKGDSNLGASPGSDVPTSSAEPAATRQTDCASEVNVAVDVLQNNGNDALYQAIGMANKLWHVIYSQNVWADFSSDVQFLGISGAEDRITKYALTGCQAEGNPLLTEGQVTSLEQLVTGNDLDALQHVIHFAASLP